MVSTPHRAAFEGVCEEELYASSPLASPRGSLKSLSGADASDVLGQRGPPRRGSHKSDSSGSLAPMLSSPRDGLTMRPQTEVKCQGAQAIVSSDNRQEMWVQQHGLDDNLLPRISQHPNDSLVCLGLLSLVTVVTYMSWLGPPLPCLSTFWARTRKHLIIRVGKGWDRSFSHPLLSQHSRSGLSGRKSRKPSASVFTESGRSGGDLRGVFAAHPHFSHPGCAYSFISRE